MTILNEIPTRGRVSTVRDEFPGHGVVIRDARLNHDGAEIPAELREAIALDPEFPKIPWALINPVLDLYIKMMHRVPSKKRAGSEENEVSVVLMRDAETLRKWRIMVPTQSVGKAFVQADYERPLVDIVTGEKFDNISAITGWVRAGTSHSHNTFGAYFSATDDRHELPQNGVHFIFGNFVPNGDVYKYDCAMSIVYHEKRYKKIVDISSGSVLALEWDAILDFDVTATTPAHASAMDVIHLEKPKDWDDAGFSSEIETLRNKGRHPRSDLLPLYGGYGGYSSEDYDYLYGNLSRSKSGETYGDPSTVPFFDIDDVYLFAEDDYAAMRFDQIDAAVRDRFNMWESSWEYVESEFDLGRAERRTVYEIPGMPGTYVSDRHGGFTTMRRVVQVTGAYAIANCNSETFWSVHLPQILERENAIAGKRVSSEMHSLALDEMDSLDAETGLLELTDIRTLVDRWLLDPRSERVVIAAVQNHWRTGGGKKNKRGKKKGGGR